MINLEDVKKLYFVGIGGIAMSAAANIAAQKGFEVSGSDSREIYSPAKDVLDFNKITYTTGYNKQNVVDSKADLFILSAGENETNPEVAYILNNGFSHASFAELLYHLFEENLRVVVAGTHGKSTTAGLLGHLFKSVDDSSFLAGAVLQNYESNFYVGPGHYFIVEGDEYKSEFDDPTPKFQYYKPDILVLTNLEYDHPDMFASVEDMEKEFEILIESVPPDGLIIYNGDDERLVKLVHASNVSQVSFGIDNEADFHVEDVKYDKDYTTIEISNKFSKNITAHALGVTEQYKIQLPGKINVYNALAAIAAMRALGFSQDQISLELIAYRGVKRRFELVGVKNGITLIDDYAHHPTAIRETLEAARLRYFSTSNVPLPGRERLGEGENAHGKLWAIFEPHTFSRTKATLPELLTAFNSADEVLISEIYPAREKASDHTITSQEVVDAIKLATQNSQLKTRLVKSRQDALDIIKSEAKPVDVVLIMAVGNFNRLAYELKDIL